MFNDSWRGGGTGLGAYTLKPRTASEIALTLQGVTGQTANLLEIKNVGGTTLFSVNNDGNLSFSGSGTITIDATVTDDLTVGDTLTVTGATTLGAATLSTLTVTGATIFGTASDPASFALFRQEVRISDDLTVTGQTILSGPVIFGSSVVIPGVSSFADGTAAAPSITFTTDLDTGLYRAAANQLGFAVAGAVELTLDGTNLSPGANDGSALGVSGTAWADLFLASGAVINFSASNYTITHASGAVTLASAATAGGAVALTLTPGAHTAVTAQVNDFALTAHTITVTGGFTAQNFVRLNQPTISAASGLTITNSATMSILSPTVAGSAVITNTASLSVGTATGTASTIANDSGSTFAHVSTSTTTIALSTTTQVTSACFASAAKFGIITINQTGGAVTVDNSATIYVAGAVAPGASVTLTNPYSIFVDAGLSRFDGGITMNGSTIIGVSSAITGTAGTALTISTPAHASELAGTNIKIQASAAVTATAQNYAGGIVQLQPGASTGSAAPGYVDFLGTSGTTKMTVSSYGANDTLIGQAATYITYFGIFAGPPTLDFAILRTASSVNYLQVAGAVTTAEPSISALGTDTDINIRLIPKGTGVVDASTSSIRVKRSVADVTTPTDAELDATFGDPTVVGSGFIGILDDNDAGTASWIVWTTGTAGEWFFAAGTKAT